MALDRGYAADSTVVPASLLPQSATPFERAASLTGATRRPLPAYLVKEVDDPWTCPDYLLGYCAFHYSVDLWRNEWPVAKKRSVIAHAIELARLKGTYTGISRAIAIMDGLLIKAIVPQPLFLSLNYTDAERQAFLDRQPQLRVYPFRTHGTKIGLMPGDCLRPVADSGNLKWFPIRTDAELRATPRSFIWDQGVETELTTVQRRWTTEVASIDEFVEIHAHGTGIYGRFVGECLPLFPVASTAASRVYTLHTSQTRVIPGEEKLALNYVKPSLTPVNVMSTLVEAHGFRKAMFGGSAFVGTRSRLGDGMLWAGFPVRSTAGERVYHRLYLWDPSRPATPQNATTFAGDMRLPMPPKNAELKVRIRDKRSTEAFDNFVHGYLSRGSTDGLDGALEAVRTHKVLSEKILVNTKTTGPLQVLTGLKAGTAVAGQLTEIH